MENTSKVSLKAEPEQPLTLTELHDTAKKRISLINDEFTKGFDFIEHYAKSVTIFGSARTKKDDKYYKMAESLSGKIVKELGYSILTGGGPGIMEASNKGAFDAGGKSIGLTIKLPTEQKTNDYVTDHVDFHYFFSRKVCMTFSAEAYIFFPGGFGTLNELFELTTLVQTGKIEKVPLILVGSDFWNEMDTFLSKSLLSRKMIDEKDLSIYSIMDNEDKIIEIIKSVPIRNGLRLHHGIE